MKFELPLAVLLTAMYAVGGANGYCCFIVSMLESSGLPSEFVGQFIRNPSGMEKINDHLFWRNREDDSQLVFWDSRIDVRISGCDYVSGHSFQKYRLWSDLWTVLQLLQLGISVYRFIYITRRFFRQKSTDTFLATEMSADAFP